MLTRSAANLATRSHHEFGNGERCLLGLIGVKGVCQKNAPADQNQEQDDYVDHRSKLPRTRAGLPALRLRDRGFSMTSRLCQNDFVGTFDHLGSRLPNAISSKGQSPLARPPDKWRSLCGFITFPMTAMCQRSTDVRLRTRSGHYFARATRLRSRSTVNRSSPRGIAPERYSCHRQTNRHKARELVGANARCCGNLGRRLTAAAGQGHSQRANKKRPQAILPKRLSYAAALAA